MRSKIFTIFALAALVASAAVAGEKCTGETQQCLNYMAKSSESKGWIGIEGDKVEGKGYTVTKVIAGSPAEKSGLKAGDVIVAFEGISLASESEELQKAWKSKMKPGNTIEYTIVRDGHKKSKEITLAKMPEDVFAKMVGKHMLQHADTQTAAANP
ncbi:MAG: PDZ domain-containing protein [Candidatus Latescibacterota bacterium]|nr:MAG: PDZ domain-containing protein [Candidatus Latescibacterota bacterium]